jgi:integrase
MATSKRGSKYRTDFILKGQRFLKTTETRQEGEQWEALIRLNVSLGKSPEELLEVTEKTHMTLRQGLAKAKQAWAGTKNEALAISNAEDIIDYLGADTAFRNLTDDNIHGLIQWLRTRTHAKAKRKQAPLSNATINRKLAALSKMTSIARKAGEPIRYDIPHLKESEGRLRFLTKAEETAVLADLRDNEGEAMYEFVAFAIDTGGRLSELLQLTPRTIVQTSAGHAAFFAGNTTKSGKSRTVPLTNRASSIALKRSQGSSLWPTNWNQHTVTHAWARMRTRLGLAGDTEFVFHACRHTCGTRLLEATGNLALVKDWLGHSDIRVTTRYAKVVTSSLTSAVQALETMTHSGESHPAQLGVKSGGNLTDHRVDSLLDSPLENQ